MKHFGLLLLALAVCACGFSSRKQQAPEAPESVQAVAADPAPVEEAVVLPEDLPAAEEPAPAIPPVAESAKQPVMAETLPAASNGIQVGGVVEFDKTLHDFGDISVQDGPQQCTFTVTNISEQPVVIYEVVSSCGCTDVQWTREPLQPGKSGTISATYNNEDGAMPFDKTLTVYLTGLKKPVTLHIRGVVHEKKMALSELYGAQKLGAFGLKTRRFSAGTLLQGEATADEALVANLGRKPLRVDFTDVDPCLTLSVDPNPSPPGKTATLRFGIRSDSTRWGHNAYLAQPVLNGARAEDRLTFLAATQENFAAWPAERRATAARPVFDNSTVSFGTVDAGTRVEAAFPFTNQGQFPLRIYSIDSDVPGLTANLPAPTPSGEKGSVPLTLDTSSLHPGENVILITLTTNSPFRPLVNLFLVGVIR